MKVVAGTGLARDRPSQCPHALACAALDYTLEEAGDQVRGLRGDDLFAPGRKLFEQPALTISDGGDEQRLHQGSAGGEHPVRLGQFLQGDLRGA